MHYCHGFMGGLDIINQHCKFIDIMNTAKTLCILALFAVVSCRTNVSNSTEFGSAPNAESIISSDEWIEFSSTDSLIKETESLSPEEAAQMKAALFRFYSHVKLEDGVYQCNLSSGKEINISEELFNVLLANLQETNSQIKEFRDKGVSVFLPEVTEDYLNSLLQ